MAPGSGRGTACYPDPVLNCIDLGESVESATVRKRPPPQLATHADVVRAVIEGSLKVLASGTILTRAPNKPWKVAKLSPCSNGRYGRLIFCHSGGRFRGLAHRVVWMALRGDIPPPLQVNHIDGNGWNNSIENFELATAKQNVQHSIAMGRIDPHRSKNRRVAASQREAIRSRRRDGWSVDSCAREFGVTASTIRRILREQHDP